MRAPGTKQVEPTRVCGVAPDRRCSAGAGDVARRQLMAALMAFDTSRDDCSASNVSSTRPNAPRGQPRGRGWDRWRRRLPAVAAVLGLVATLWATLVGQSIPDLVRDENAPIRAFQARLEKTCYESAALERLNERASQERLVLQDARDLRETLGDELGPKLARISAPSLYRAQFESLRHDFERADRAAPGLYRPGRDYIPGRVRHANRARARSMEAYLDDAADQARMMQAPNCGSLLRGLAGIPSACSRATTPSGTKRTNGYAPVDEYRCVYYPPTPRGIPPSPL
jgi:hypothetical protein